MSMYGSAAMNPRNPKPGRFPRSNPARSSPRTAGCPRRTAKYPPNNAAVTMTAKPRASRPNSSGGAVKLRERAMPPASRMRAPTSSAICVTDLDLKERAMPMKLAARPTRLPAMKSPHPDTSYLVPFQPDNVFRSRLYEPIRTGTGQSLSTARVTDVANRSRSG